MHSALDFVSFVRISALDFVKNRQRPATDTRDRPLLICYSGERAGILVFCAKNKNGAYLTSAFLTVPSLMRTRFTAPLTGLPMRWPDSV